MNKRRIARIGLDKFYDSVKMSHPRVANLMAIDIYCLGLYAAIPNRQDECQLRADRLRQIAIDHKLDESQYQRLDTALTKLGYK